MDFGGALQALKDGKCVSRVGWNGKKMHIYLEDHLYRTMPRANVRGKVTYTDDGKYEPCVVLFTAQGTHQPGWVCSQPDMLADDWGVVWPS